MMITKPPGHPRSLRRRASLTCLRAAIAALVLITEAPVAAMASFASGWPLAEGMVPDSLAGRFEKVVLVDHTTRPNELEAAPDGRVFFIEREGAVRAWNPDTGTTTMVGFVPVEAVHTSGLLGMTLDPKFSENGWIYLYYSPRWNNAVNELARFTIVDGEMLPGSKKVLLQILVDRYIDQAHSGGSIEFGPDGNLFLSTGDNTNPTEVQYYSSIDERPGRALWDVQRTSSNTNDLRGKILRIRPTPQGGYSIPQGNLFDGDSLHRPEIYTMGHRNPFRISIDADTGWLYWGDVGPGPSAGSEERGPVGFDEINRAQEPGNFGWPYFVGDNKPYRDYDFATGKSGPYFDPKAPVNDSPNNTGARRLPPARPALIWYPHGPSDRFPQLGSGGEAAMAGPVYRYNPAMVHRHGLPASLDGVLFIFDFMRNWIMQVSFDEDGDLAGIEPFLPEMEFRRPFDMDIGPDGRVYLIEWGSSYEGWFNDDARIVRLDYYPSGTRQPVGEDALAAEAAEFDRTAGSESAVVSRAARRSDRTDAFDAARSSDRTDASDAAQDSDRAEAGDAAQGFDRTEADDAAQGSDRTEADDLTAGSRTEPSRLSPYVAWPDEGTIFDFDRPIEYRLGAAGQTADGDVIVQPILVHDSHTHALTPQPGRNGSMQIRPDSSHVYLESHHVVLKARHTDRDDAGPEPARSGIVLQPRRIQAEHATSRHGAELDITGDDTGGSVLRVRREIHIAPMLENDSFLSFAPINLLNIDSMTVRMAVVEEGVLEVRLDSPHGPVLERVELRPVLSNEREQKAEDGSGDESEEKAEDESEDRSEQKSDNVSEGKSKQKGEDESEGEREQKSDNGSEGERESENWTTVTVPVADPVGRPRALPHSAGGLRRDARQSGLDRVRRQRRTWAASLMHRKKPETAG